MNHHKIICVVAMLCVLNISRVEVLQAATVSQKDISGRGSETNLIFPDGRIISISEGQNYTVHEECIASYRGETGWYRVPIKPQKQIHISFKQVDAARTEYLIAGVGMVITQRRKVILNYPPVSSV